jgi:hypothetical protein
VVATRMMYQLAMKAVVLDIARGRFLIVRDCGHTGFSVKQRQVNYAQR